MKVLIVLSCIGMALFLYACCVVAGNADRMEEQMAAKREQEEEQKKFYDPVWLDDDRKYSGLLSEDDE